jgi:hypothetical protein
MRIISRKRLTEIFLSLQTTVIAFLLYWTYLEDRSNAFLRTWLSQNFPAGLTLLNEWIVGGAITGLLLVTGYWIIQLEREGGRGKMKVGPLQEAPFQLESDTRPVPPKATAAKRGPIYETVEMRSFIILLILGTQAISLWFITASTFRVTIFPANSFYYYSHLPITYWWGLGATLALFFIRPNLQGRTRIGLEISTLFILALYLIGLPSFAYQDPRFLDTYYHMGNSLDLLNYQGWLTSPAYYVHQFPGEFAFVGQLTSVAGIDPFQLMRFYPLSLSLIIVFLAYVVARAHSPQYASTASAVLLGGLWFQLHISPQSLELILYLGVILLFVKIIDDEPRRKLWTILGILSAPIFVASHPETPLAVSLGLAGFLVLSLLKSRRTFNEQAGKMTLPFLVLVGVILIWWATIAVDVRVLVQTSIIDRVLQALLRGSPGPTAPTARVAATPSYSYGLTVLSEQAVSVLVWGVGLALFAFFRKLQPRELFLGGLLLAAVSTIPIALFGREDVLQRSYLFALFPFVILTAWLLERKAALTLRGWNFFRPLKVGFIIMMVLFAFIIPLTRYGVDPVEYIPGSSLYVSNIAANLFQQHSVLFLHPDEDGWRFYAGINGAIREPKAEQNNLTNQQGGYVKSAADPTVPGFNLTYTPADNSANYIVLTNYWQNLYTLRFGSNSGFYLQARSNYTAAVTQNFDLVYSTGTDQIYANEKLG